MTHQGMNGTEEIIQLAAGQVFDREAERLVGRLYALTDEQNVYWLGYQQWYPVFE
jgi:hypothetical protein